MTNQIQIAVPNLKGNEAKYLLECIDQNFVSTIGPFVEEFETQLKQLTGAKFAIATNTGTSAIHLALLGVGTKPNDIVLAPNYSFIASANAIRHCGADPWFIDFRLNDWGMDPSLLEAELEQNTRITDEGVFHRTTGKKVSAILAVHAAGNPADATRIDQIGKRFSLPIIYDGAAALGATVLGDDISNFGNATTLSFNGNKTFTAGGGGCVLTNSEPLAEKIRHLSSTARISKNYDHDEVGYNYRITNIQAAVGKAQLECFDQFLTRKRSILARYNMEFSKYAGIAFPDDSQSLTSAWVSGIVLPSQEEFNAQQFKSYLLEHGVEARSFWKPMHLQSPFGKSVMSTVNNSNDFYSRIIILPNSTSLTESDEDQVVETVHDYFRNPKQ